MTSVARIDLERIDFLVTKLLAKGEGLNGDEYSEFQTLVGGRPEPVAALVHAVKAARAIEYGNQSHVQCVCEKCIALRDALRPFTEEPGQPQNDDLGDALRPSQSNGGEQK